MEETTFSYRGFCRERDVTTIKEFYGRNVTRPFWYWGGDIYTIVPGRHIGADWGWIDHFTDVPALVAGRVAASFTSPILGGVVVVATGLSGNYAYITYCHLFNGDMLRYGDVVTQGQRVGRLAKSGESHGSAWGGEHCHVVCSRNTNGAYQKSPSNTASTYSDPETLAATVLAETAGEDARPFPDEKEEDDMFTDEDRKALEDLRNLAPIIHQVNRRLETQIGETRKTKTLASRILELLTGE